LNIRIRCIITQIPITGDDCKREYIAKPGRDVVD